MTGQENDRQNYRYENHYHEDDISLIDLLCVVWKWKWLIIVGVAICVVAAAVISFQMPRIYEVSMYIEPGIIGVKENGDFLYIDSYENLSNKIAEGVYNKKLEKMLSQNLPQNNLEFKSKPMKGGNLIKVTSRWEENITNLGMKVSWQLLNLITDAYESMVESTKDSYEKRIILMQKSVGGLERELKLQQEMYVDLKHRKKELLGEIRRVQDNMGKIVQQKNSYEKSERDRSFFLVLHSMTIQQNVVYSQMNDQLRDVENTKKDIETKSVELQESIDDTQSEVTKLQYEKGLIGNIKIIQQPEVSPNPVAPQKKQIILLAGVASLFMFIFLAFFIEYVRNAIRVRQNTQDAVVEE